MRLYRCGERERLTAAELIPLFLKSRDWCIGCGVTDVSVVAATQRPRLRAEHSQCEAGLKDLAEPAPEPDVGQGRRITYRMLVSS